MIMLKLNFCLNVQVYFIPSFSLLTRLLEKVGNSRNEYYILESKFWTYGTFFLLRKVSCNIHFSLENSNGLDFYAPLWDQTSRYISIHSINFFSVFFLTLNWAKIKTRGFHLRKDDGSREMNVYEILNKHLLFNPMIWLQI